MAKMQRTRLNRRSGMKMRGKDGRAVCLCRPSVAQPATGGREKERREARVSTAGERRRRARAREEKESEQTNELGVPGGEWPRWGGLI